MTTLHHHQTGRSSEMSAVDMIRKRKRFVPKNLGYNQTIDTKKQKYVYTTIPTNLMRCFSHPSTLSSAVSTLPSSQTVHKENILAEKSNIKPMNSDTKNNKPRVHKVFGVKKTKKQVHFASIADVVFFYKGDEPGMFSNFKVEPVDFCHKEKPSRVKKRRR